MLQHTKDILYNYVATVWERSMYECDGQFATTFWPYCVDLTMSCNGIKIK